MFCCRADENILHLHVDNISDEDEHGHGDGAEGRGVHDDLCGVFRLVVEFDGVHGRVDGGRDGAVNEEDDGGYRGEGSRREIVPKEDGYKADDGEEDELDEAGQPYFAIEPFDFRPR